jgi:hypothetical protein
MSADRDRDPNQRTTAPAGVLGGPAKPEAAPKTESGDKRAAKSAFAHTIVQVPGTGPAQDNSASDAEPLREPSDRPAPAPYRAQGAWGGTQPTPDPAPTGSRSEERMIAAKPVQAPAPVKSPAALYIKPGATMAMPTIAEDPVPQPQAAQRPPQSAQPKGMPTQVMGTPAAGHVISPAPPPPSRSDRAPQAPKLTPAAGPRLQATGPVPASDASPHSQPLSLSLHARDHLESAGPAAVASSRTAMWIMASIGVVVVLGILIWLFKPSSKPDVPVTPVVPPTAAAPVITPEPLPGATPAPTTPAQAVAPEAAPPAAVPVPAVKPEPEKPAVQKATTRPSKAAVARKKKKAAAVKEKPVLQVKPSRSGEEEDDLEEAARAAERLSEKNDAPPSPDEPPAPDGE